MGSIEVHVPAARGGLFATVAFARPEIVNGVDGRLEQTLCGQSCGFIRNCPKSRRG